MTRPREPLLCAVSDCIRPRAGGDLCSGHILAWHRDGWAERAWGKSDEAKVREAFLRGDASPPERLLRAVVP